MKIEITTPIIDKKAIDEKAQQFANEAIITEIKDYYTDWNSPYRKAIKEYLADQKIGFKFDLPNIVSQLNKSISTEIDKIVNEAIANTYIPMLGSIIGQGDPIINLSDILKEFISESDTSDEYDFSFSMEKNESHGWYNIEMGDGKETHKFTLHSNSYGEAKEKGYYQLLSLPYNVSGKYNEDMELKVKDATLKMPFVHNILGDRFMAYLANIVLFNTMIILDVDGFSEEMFYTED